MLMMITLIIYLSIISYIIVKGFYKTIKSNNNNQKIEKFNDTINLISIPFYINIHNINLLCIFINLFLISFIFLPDLILNNSITYCQDFFIDDDEESNTNSSENLIQLRIEKDIYNNMHKNKIMPGWQKPIEETYKISNINRFFIYHLNYKYIKIDDTSKVFKGFIENLDDIINKQNQLFLHEMKGLDENSVEGKKIYDEIYEKNRDTLKLTFTAYNKMIDHYLDNDIIENEIGILNQKAANTFNALKNIQISNQENLGINNNISRIGIINISQENKVKSFNELFTINLKERDIIREDNIRNNINNFHLDYYKNIHLNFQLIDRGFILLNKNNK